MRALGSVVVSVMLVVLVASTPVRAAEAEQSAPQRSAVSGLGVALVGLGVAGLGLGLAGTLIAADASRTLSVYAPNGVPNQADAGIVSVFSRRQGLGSGLAIGGFAGGAALLVGGLICLLVDSPRVALAVVPGRQGLTVSAQLRF